MQRSQYATILFISLTLGSGPLQATEKVRVEVVEALTFLYTDSVVGNVPSTPEQTITNCQGTSGIYLPNYGSTCVTTKNPATPEHPVIWPTAMGFFDAVEAILPGGDHLLLICDRYHEKHCGEFVDEKSASIEKNCKDVSEQLVVGVTRFLCEYTMRGASSLGVFQAEIDRNKVTIWGPSGKRQYDRSGTWGSANTSQAGKSVESPASPPVANTAGITAANDAPIDSEVLSKANAGDADAQNNLGLDYFNGQGVPQDYAQAASWFRKAAEQGYADAQNNLGLLYGYGKGVPQDYALAASWYLKAADKGAARAQNDIGVLYFNGQGVPQNYAEAYFWETLAAAGAKGPELVQVVKNRDDSASKLLPADLLKAQERAAKWFAEHPAQP